MTHRCDISSSFLAGSTVAEASHRASRGHAPVLWSARVERREWRELPPRGRPARARARSPGGYVLYVRRRGAIFHTDRHCRPRRAIRPRQPLRRAAQHNSCCCCCIPQFVRTFVIVNKVAGPKFCARGWRGPAPPRPPATTGADGTASAPRPAAGEGPEEGHEARVLIAVEFGWF